MGNGQGSGVRKAITGADNKALEGVAGVKKGEIFGVPLLCIRHCRNNGVVITAVFFKIDKICRDDELEIVIL